MLDALENGHAEVIIFLHRHIDDGLLQNPRNVVGDDVERDSQRQESGCDVPCLAYVHHDEADQVLYVCCDGRVWSGEMVNCVHCVAKMNYVGQIDDGVEYGLDLPPLRSAVYLLQTPP